MENLNIFDINEQQYALEKIYSRIKIEHQLFGIDTHGHAYSLLDIKKNLINGIYYFVMEIRNSWGN